eukprot:scaffold1303_cov65-Cylindrotheca_fusiformis.AAC.1
MKQVSALILLSAFGVHSLVSNTNGNSNRLHQPALGKAATVKVVSSSNNGPLSATSLQQARWDYRDGSSGSSSSGNTYYPERFPNPQNVDAFPMQPMPLQQQPQVVVPSTSSTDTGWWNEEKKDYSTVENRRDRRKYSNSKYGSSMVPISYNTNTNNNNNYEVTPEEWRTNDRYETMGSPYQQQQPGPLYNNVAYQQQPRQVVQATDPGVVNLPPPPQPQFNNMNDPNSVTPPEWRESRMPPPSNNHQFGPNNNNMNNNMNQFGPNNNMNNNNFGPPSARGRGEVVGSYDPNDVTPQEWKDQKRLSQNGGQYQGPPPPPFFPQQQQQQGPMMNNNNNFQYQQPQQPFYNNNYEDINNGLYDPTNGQSGSWWTEEKRDFSTNLGRRETRNYGGGNGNGNMSFNDRNSVTPEEWRNSNNGFDQERRINYIERVQGPPPPVRNWWDNVKNGFRNVSVNSNNNQRNNNNNGYNNGYNYNSNGYNNNNGYNYNNGYNNNNGYGYNNVGYNNNNGYNNNYNNNNGYNNNYNNYNNRYDTYYDEYQRPEYVTQQPQQADWWNPENRNYYNTF